MALEIEWERERRAAAWNMTHKYRSLIVGPVIRAKALAEGLLDSKHLAGKERERMKTAVQQARRIMSVLDEFEKFTSPSLPKLGERGLGSIRAATRSLPVTAPKTELASQKKLVKGLVAAALAHHVNSPLQAIMGQAQLAAINLSEEQRGGPTESC